MAAERQSPAAIRQWLIRLGHLCFDDFLLLPAETLDFGHWTPDLTVDWTLTLNNAPHVLRHLGAAGCRLPIGDARPCPSTPSIASAQTRLVTHFAYELLRAKAPPLYDALPWHDWDFSIVTKRFPLWKTRLLLAGDGATVAMCRCRKSAGVYVVEPDETIARYTERKAVLEKVRRFRLLPSAVSSPGPPSLAPIRLPDNSVDLAIIGSCPDLETGNWKLVIDELVRVAANVLLIENNPILQPLDERSLIDTGFRPDSVDVLGLGPRRCWWKRA